MEFPQHLTLLNVKKDILPALGLHYEVGEHLLCWEPIECTFVPVSTLIVMPHARDTVLLKDASVKGSLEGLGEGISYIEKRDAMYGSRALRYVPLFLGTVDIDEDGVSDTEQVTKVGKKGAKVDKGKGREVPLGLSDSE